MSERLSAMVDGAADEPVSLRTGLYRYLFYDWLFRDADRGTRMEQASALRHNRAQAKWLPIYLLRWAVGGALLLTLEVVLERALSPVLSAALAMAVVFAVMYLLVTTICWAFLHGRRQ